MLPAQAIQSSGPALKILKRPSSAASDRSLDRQQQNSANASAKSLKEREKAYEEAKKRIYGDASTSQEKSSSSSMNKAQSTPQQGKAKSSANQNKR